jgi:biopolymer transport protein ExbD
MLESNQLVPSEQGLRAMVPKPAPMGSARVDMTAMIDLVFMMNIFFLVTSLVAALAEIDLPAAKHVVAADLETSVVLTVMAGEGGRPRVYLGDGASSEPLPEAEQDERIAAAVEEELKGGKTAVIIKAEKNVPMREIARIAADATAREGTKLNLAVMEKD